MAYSCTLVTFPTLRKNMRYFQLRKGGVTANKYNISDLLSYKHLSHSQKAFNISISSQLEPKYHNQIVKYSNWRDSLFLKLAILESNNT